MLSIIGGVALTLGVAMQPPAAYPLVPAPRSLAPREGAFVLDDATSIVLQGAATRADVRAMVERWAGPIRVAAGVPLRIVTAAPERNVVVVRLDAGATLAGDRWSPGDESFVLDIANERVRLSARDAPGLFYALQSLRQLLPAAVERGRRVAPGVTFAWPALQIEDAPRFAYRGMHLDVGRHFFPVEFIKRYIDLLALFRFNAFHWHLTEDQGWRIEIKKYPRLTEVGAYRRETILGRNFDPYVGDGVPYGGFYTQDEVRDVVAYARDRHITVIPEIEMPGHSVAALAAYPELACTPGPFNVATRWGVFEDIYCPSERTFAFLEDVLTEVMALFPSRYIHIGGDEAPKARWEASSLAQEVMRREGLADAHELQSWFIRRIERFLLANGRRLIGWDEILEGGLAPEATVMSWRGVEGGIAAAREGHDVIMTPNSHVYFDHYQGDRAQEPLAIGGFSPLEKVYAFEPVPEALTESEARRVLGAQGNVWTEYMKTSDRVEYMAFPRMLALAEVLWSPREHRDWTGFMTRLGPQLERLSVLGVDYRVPDVLGLEADVRTAEDSVLVTLGPVWASTELRFTLDGSDPSPASPRYTGPFYVDLRAGARTVAARLILRDGRLGAVRRARFERSPDSPSSTETEPGESSIPVSGSPSIAVDTIAFDLLDMESDHVANQRSRLGSRAADRARPTPSRARLGRHRRRHARPRVQGLGLRAARHGPGRLVPGVRAVRREHVCGAAGTDLNAWRHRVASAC